MLANPQGSGSKTKAMMPSSRTLKQSFKKHTTPYNSEAFPSTLSSSSPSPPNPVPKHRDISPCCVSGAFLMAPVRDCESDDLRRAVIELHDGATCTSQESPDSPEAMLSRLPFSFWIFQKCTPEILQKISEKKSPEIIQTSCSST